MAIVIIVLLNSRMRKDFFRLLEPLLIKVKPALLANMAPVMLFISIIFIYLNMVFHLIAAEHTTDDKQFIFVINTLKLRFLFKPYFALF